ncbi:thioesterase [Gordonia polyisoprenivorans]|uniref:thioesterase II family protein n=1 Tax=Gordonia TaxID=2053 RepID=UPI000379BAF2|nr:MULTISPECIES: alpha/beta fold hydrolase [Gordonia]MDF3281915.1 alpha/beta fold hydrolase [Gordonia sp. N1V]OPX15324.1 thioesterase [Gordonia sp. i37]QUD85065.1 thioesterase [Gordonia polyisoprenivorans]
MTAPTLYIFPHAGGSAAFYVPFARTFTTDIGRVAVQYPGKNGSQDLAAFTGIDALADTVLSKLPAFGPDTRVAFFGHSMGALVAFETARRLEQRGVQIEALFVSACAAPGRSGYEYIPESDRGLLDAVSAMTGLDPAMLQDEAFSSRILPTLRGFKAITAYECPPEVTLACPIHAYHADNDEVATAEKVAPWEQRTSAEFTMREFPGHHFYLSEHLADVAADIERRLSATED